MPTTLIPTGYQLPALILLAVGGLIAWAAGYRLFRFVLTLFGFYIGALAASAVLGPGDRTLIVFAALGGGAVGALIMFFGYFVGVALVGAGIGAFTVHMIWSRLGTDPHAFVVILVAVAGAAAAMALQRYVIIVSTAFSGAWTLSWSVQHLVDRSPNVPMRPSVWMVYPFDLAQGRTWMLAAWAVMGLVGVFIQLRFTGRVKAIVRAKPPRPK
ncbi:MAG: DUF4203 domain-containing protein [Acidobacteria bacterium]|nr:MAG: DUF4203 domain-containing protein [Acidobacteriota bacterium]